MLRKTKIALVAGARPNFIKIAPLIKEFKKYKKAKIILVHTGQHYDKKMSKVFFEDLKIPKPNINLEVGLSKSKNQICEIMTAFNGVLEKLKPDLVIVVGDVNSTIACAVSAKKHGIKVAHVEAGLRSFDWSMPEEINRVLTDELSDFLFCTEQSGVKNLLSEGTAKDKIHFVGNVMIDTLLAQRKTAEKSKILKNLGLNKKFATLTLHRPSNVDNEKSLRKIIKIIEKVALKIPVIFPIHPRTQKNLAKWQIPVKNIKVTEPVGYLDFLQLISHSTLVLTDSGGIQEETTILGVPCLTLRKNTERPVTVQMGTNQILGTNQEKILRAVDTILKNPARKAPRPPLWDGKASARIVNILLKKIRNS